MSTVLTAQGISEEYAEEIWFRDVLGRLWPAYEKLLTAEMAAAGAKVGVKGKVSRDTCSKKQWKKILSLLTAFTTTWVSRKTQKSDVVRSKYFGSVDAKADPDADPSTAQCFWSEHPLPDPALVSKGRMEEAGCRPEAEGPLPSRDVRGAIDALLEVLSWPEAGPVDG